MDWTHSVQLDSGLNAFDELMVAQKSGRAQIYANNGSIYMKWIRVTILKNIFSLLMFELKVNQM